MSSPKRSHHEAFDRRNHMAFDRSNLPYSNENGRGRRASWSGISPRTHEFTGEHQSVRSPSPIRALHMKFGRTLGVEDEPRTHTRSSMTMSTGASGSTISNKLPDMRRDSARSHASSESSHSPPEKLSKTSLEGGASPV